MNTKISKFINNIDFAFEKCPNTPRIALYFNFSIKDMPAGVYSLMVKLFMQGTKNRSAQQLSEELDKYAIDFSAELKSDYIKFRIVCLNEDFEKAVEILNDIIKNTTFEDFEKEKLKLENEIIAELDSPRAKVIDSYYKNIYEGHSYGYTNTVILDNLKNIKREDVLCAYNSMINCSKKVIVFAGDLEYEKVNSLLQEKFIDLPDSKLELSNTYKLSIQEPKLIETIQKDLNQAHILKGWLVDTADKEDYAALSLLNIILGASGLSSRLFLELRDKKGLAYVVRSSYDSAKFAANFSIYIATEPKNVETSLNGFNEEIEKIKTIPISEEELENAKNNFLGKLAFITETNAQKANRLAHYGILGYGFEYCNKACEKIKKVTIDEIQTCANKYFNDKFVLAIIKP